MSACRAFGADPGAKIGQIMGDTVWKLATTSAAIGGDILVKKSEERSPKSAAE